VNEIEIEEATTDEALNGETTIIIIIRPPEEIGNPGGKRSIDAGARDHARGRGQRLPRPHPLQLPRTMTRRRKASEYRKVSTKSVPFMC
jgi:hypothetical protein